MRKFVGVICASSLLTGCVDADLSKLVPGSASLLRSTIQSAAIREASLISALQLEDETLDFMSAGTYGCGDPQDKQQRKYLNAKDPAKFVKEENVTKAWQKSLDFIGAYLVALNTIADANKEQQQALANLGSIASDVAKNVPGFSAGTTTAVVAFQKVISTGILYYNASQMQEAARLMEVPLETAVGNVTKLYPVFSGNVHTAFVKWDSCAREKLRFIRDNPLGKVPRYPELFALETGTRLDEAYAVYASKRNELRGTPPIASLLKAVLDENRRLADPTKSLTLDDLAISSKNAASIYNDITAAIKAGEALGLPSTKL